jgi:hypothetical protein
MARPKAGAVHAATPSWQWEDFFSLTLAEEIALKRRLAACLGVKYTDVVNGAKPFAISVAGVEPWDADKIARAHAAYHLTKRDLLMDHAIREAQLKATNSISTVVSGLMLAWSGTVSPNVGYIKRWSDQNLEKWDPTIERKAGGLDLGISFSSQHLAVTNFSSLLALMASVVNLYKTTGTVPQRESNWFLGVRVLLYFDATPDELMVMNHVENIEQFERKRHNELDNVDAVYSWMESVRNLPGQPLDPDKALDVMKYAAILGDPRAPTAVPGWLQDGFSHLR